MPMWAEPPKACSSAVRCVCICVQYRSRFSALRCNSNTGAVSFLCVRFTSSRERVSTGARRVSCARLARVGDVTFERYCMCHSVFNGMTLLTQLAADQYAQKKINVNRRPKLDQLTNLTTKLVLTCTVMLRYRNSNGTVATVPLLL